MAFYREGKIYQGSSASGTPLGYIKDGKIYKTGGGSDLGYIKGSEIYKAGGGSAIFNVKNGSVNKATGQTLAKAKDCAIQGMERESEAAMVAAYHFLVKNLV
jgi:hypothetical protein